MHLKFDNVNDAFYGIVKGIHAGDIPTRKQSSRNGDTLQVEEPMLVTYANPRRRVLFNPARDANPFFHLYEALWMLAGRNDVAPLAYYVKKFKDYSDDGKTLNGAYGYRWRKHDHHYEMEPYIDQLQVIIDHLKTQPNSRRAVLTMWNVEDDLLKIGSKGTLVHADGGSCQGTPLALGVCPKCGIRPDMQSTEIWDKSLSKDVCCNLSVMFSLRTIIDRNDGVPNQHGDVKCSGLKAYKYLDMTVTNRSNDIIWGMLGANYVHFTILQEYMASKLGVEVGVYNHFTNNAHVYLNNWKPDEWLKVSDYHYPPGAQYRGEILPLMRNEKFFDSEIHQVTEHYGDEWEPKLYNEPFFRLAMTLFYWHWGHKQNRNNEVFQFVRGTIDRPEYDWEIAGREWLQRRSKS